MRSQLNKDIQALCLQFNKVHKLLSSKIPKASRKNSIYMFLLNNNDEQGHKTRFHYPDFTTSSQHERFTAEAEINRLHEKMDAIAQTLSEITKTDKKDLQFTLTFHKLYSSAAHIFLDGPSKRMSRVKANQAGRYDTLEQAMLSHLDIITQAPAKEEV